MKESLYKLTGAPAPENNEQNGGGIDIPNMLVQAADCRFITIVHPHFTLSCCTLKNPLV